MSTTSEPCFNSCVGVIVVMLHVWTEMCIFQPNIISLGIVWESLPELLSQEQSWALTLSAPRPVLNG